jgi:hypothetical protein
MTNPTSTEQQAASSRREKRWYSWLALGITCSRWLSLYSVNWAKKN